jgi:hypothetical protein
VQVEIRRLAPSNRFGRVGLKKEIEIAEKEKLLKGQPNGLKRFSVNKVTECIDLFNDSCYSFYV